MRKTVVYCATENHYPFLEVCIKSLRKHTSVDRIVCIIETDKHPDIEGVDFINYKKCTDYFEGSPNYNTVFSYMSLVRLCLTKLLPEEDKVLYLDTDTVVCDDISELWDIDLNEYALAGVAESQSYVRDVPDGKYINAGVELLNLKYLREHKLDDKMIRKINEDNYRFPDQDVLNSVCYGHIHYLPLNYNEFCRTMISSTPKIVHYAGEREWWKGINPRCHYWIENMTEHRYMDK